MTEIGREERVPTRSSQEAVPEAAGQQPGSRGRLTPDEAILVRRLRGGDRSAFDNLISAYHASLVRLARVFVSSQAVAEEVAQETWLGVLRGLPAFQGRSSLKT